MRNEQITQKIEETDIEIEACEKALSDTMFVDSAKKLKKQIEKLHSIRRKLVEEFEVRNLR